MARYRMYFVDRLGKFRWPYDLSAQDDSSALAIAHALQDACADVPVGIELWHGARRVPGISSRAPAALRPNEQIGSVGEETLLQMEEALQNSGTLIARSRRLAERMSALRMAIEAKRAGAAPESANEACKATP